MALCNPNGLLQDPLPNAITWRVKTLAHEVREADTGQLTVADLSSWEPRVSEAQNGVARVYVSWERGAGLQDVPGPVSPNTGSLLSWREGCFEFSIPCGNPACL
jgi:hypothetical protein